MDIHFPSSRWRSSLILLSLIFAESHGLGAEVLAPGDYVMTIEEAPLKLDKETLAAVPSGTKLKAARVIGDWVWVHFYPAKPLATPKKGYIHRRYLIECGENDSLRYLPWKGNIGAYRSQTWDLPPGETVIEQIRSTHAIDIFVFSEEGKAAYEWACKHGQGQAISKLTRLSVKNAKFRWTPPDGNKYYLVVNNGTFPDGGAMGRKGTKVTLISWRGGPTVPLGFRWQAN